MGRRYRRWRDERESGFEDVASAVTDAIDTISESVSAVNDPLERERRRQAKEEKRRREEASGRRSVLAAGAGLLVGGLVASSGLVTVAAVGAGLLAGGVVAIGLRWWEEGQQRPLWGINRPAERPKLEDPTIAGQDPRTALVRSVVTGAMGHLRKVDQIAATTSDLETSAILTRIAAIGHRVCHTVAAQPAVFDKAQRLLTYHAEKAAKLAELSSSAEGERQAGVRRVLGRMELLFEETEAALKHEDSRELDLELRLIDQALDEDLRR